MSKELLLPPWPRRLQMQISASNTKLWQLGNKESVTPMRVCLFLGTTTMSKCQCNGTWTCISCLLQFGEILGSVTSSFLSIKWHGQIRKLCSQRLTAQLRSPDTSAALYTWALLCTFALLSRRSSRSLSQICTQRCVRNSCTRHRAWLMWWFDAGTGVWNCSAVASQWAAAASRWARRELWHGGLGQWVKWAHVIYFHDTCNTILDIANDMKFTILVFFIIINYLGCYSALQELKSFLLTKALQMKYKWWIVKVPSEAYSISIWAQYCLDAQNMK
jgi:hypothetical protein